MVSPASPPPSHLTDVIASRTGITPIAVGEHHQLRNSEPLEMLRQWLGVNHAAPNFSVRAA